MAIRNFSGLAWRHDNSHQHPTDRSRNRSAGLPRSHRRSRSQSGAGALRDFAGALHVEGALAGLTAAADARLAAATIAEAACTADDPVAALRIRAAAIRAECWDCANPAGLAQALDGAVTVLNVM